MKIEEMVKIAEQDLVPAMDALGKKLQAAGADPKECLVIMATQMILQARFMLRLVGGQEYEAQVMYQHADKAAAEDQK